MKNFFFLMINSVYGKAMENLGQRINIRLVNNAKDYKKNYKQIKFFFTKNFLVKILLLFMRLNQF